MNRETRTAFLIGLCLIVWAAGILLGTMMGMKEKGLHDMKINRYHPLPMETYNPQQAATRDEVGL